MVNSALSAPQSSSSVFGIAAYQLTFGGPRSKARRELMASSAR
jgi:hypothetical protein